MFASLVWIALALAEAPSPELQARLDAAEAAWARGDGAEAERLLTAINDEAPAWDKPWRRRCGVVLDDGRSSDAVELCRKALAIEASVENRTALALALVRDATGLEDAGDAALAEARALLDAAAAERPDYPQAWAAMCELAILTSDAATLERCVVALERVGPDQAGTLYYRVHLDLERADVPHARKTLIAARSKGLSDDLYQPLLMRLSSAAPERASEPEPASPVTLLPWIVGAGFVLSIGALALLGDRRGGAGGAPTDPEGGPEGALPSAQGPQAGPEEPPPGAG